MKEHSLKDKILIDLKNSGRFTHVTTTEYSDEKGVDYDMLSTMVDELIELEYIESTDITSRDSRSHNKMIWIAPKGSFFISKGGFTKARKVEGRRKRLMIAKEIMTYFSTAAIIFISYLNYIATDKANDNKIIVDQLCAKIDSLSQLNATKLSTKDTVTVKQTP